MSITGSSSGAACKKSRSSWACTSSPQSVGGPRAGEEFPLECPNCGGDIRLIAFITELITVAKPCRRPMSLPLHGIRAGKRRHPVGQTISFVQVFVDSRRDLHDFHYPRDVLAILANRVKHQRTKNPVVVVVHALVFAGDRDHHPYSDSLEHGHRRAISCRALAAS